MLTLGNIKRRFERAQSKRLDGGEAPKGKSPDFPSQGSRTSEGYEGIPNRGKNDC